ncbi:MAG TPA: tRNA lysidine(34) synthetase TilS [Thermaerobacter sp.]
MARCLLDEVRAFITRHRLLAPGQRVLVAVSGGRDSVVLLDVLVRLRTELGLAALGVAHVDHGLRPDSAADAEWVRDLAAGYGLPFFLRRVQVRPGRESPEAAARTARYRALWEMARAFGADRIALAHHADDQAETVLLRLLAGAGPSGLAGMRPRRGRFVRPLLGVERAALAAYAAEQGLRWRDDPTNRDLSIPRNRVRHELLPLLERSYNPAVRRVLCRVAAIMAAEAELLARRTRRQLARLAVLGEGRGGLPLEEFRRLPVADQRRLLQALYRRLSGRGLSFDAVERLRALARATAPSEEIPAGPLPVDTGPDTRDSEDPAGAGGPAALDLPGGWRAHREGGHLWMEPARDSAAGEVGGLHRDEGGRHQEAARRPEEASYRYELPVPGSVEVPEAGLLLRAWLVTGKAARAVREALLGGDPARAEDAVARAGPPLPDKAARVVGRVLCDYNELKLPLVVRAASARERMQPLGARGRRPLRRLYRQALAARPPREMPPGRWPPLVVSGDEPLWFVGVRLAERFRVRPATEEIVVLEALATTDGTGDEPAGAGRHGGAHP